MLSPTSTSESFFTASEVSNLTTTNLNETSSHNTESKKTQIIHRQRSRLESKIRKCFGLDNYDLCDFVIKEPSQPCTIQPR